MLPWQPFLAFHMWGAHWRHLKNTTEPSMCGGDAALCQITLTICFIGTSPSSNIDRPPPQSPDAVKNYYYDAKFHPHRIRCFLATHTRLYMLPTISNNQN